MKIRTQSILRGTLAVAVLGAGVYAAIIAYKLAPIVIGWGSSAFLLKLWVIPGTAAAIFIVAACLARRLWHRHILLALSISFLIPVPLFSPDGGAVVPLGMFLLSGDAFPKSVLILAVPSVALFGIFWAVGWLVQFCKQRTRTLSNNQIQDIGTNAPNPDL